MLDYTGEGASELWKAGYPGIVPDDSDPDGDGFSNFEESVAGTDPLDETSFLKLGFSVPLPGEKPQFQWNSQAGKVYGLERLDVTSGNWEKVLTLFPEMLSRVRKVQLPPLFGQGLFRLTVSDIDVDGDGLVAWEEAQLGTSDLDTFSASRQGGDLRTDYAAVIVDLEASEGVELTNGTHMEQRRPDEAEAARFLMKASFGPTDELITEVAEVGCAAWIKQQLEMPVTLSATVLQQNGFEDKTEGWKYAWWRLVNTSPDQLRQRMAYALSQIIVVSFEGGSLVGGEPVLQAHYYDFFLNHLDRSYRELLEEVTYSPVMGWYLSHLKNRKADPVTNRFPDENFAREIMQLFTVGLWELYPDGTQKLDAGGHPIPTYDNEVITEVARVFTGMGFSTTNRGADLTTWFFNAGLPPEDWQNRLRFFPEEHDQDAKTIIGGVEIPEKQGGDADVAMTLDALCNHPSCAPFLSRLLIQRFTSSNPSPQYLERVVEVWEESGGKLDRVLEAILLDPEVLYPDDGSHQGKLREPILKFSHLTRAFHFEPTETEIWGFEYGKLRDTFGQYGMLSPSVFNFYSPEFSPQGEMRELGLHSPESELTTFTHLINTNNYLLNAVERGYNGIAPDYSVLEVLEPETGDMLDYLDLLMTGSTLTPANRLRIMNAVDGVVGAHWRIETAIHLITQCPEFVVIK